MHFHSTLVFMIASAIALAATACGSNSIPQGADSPQAAFAMAVEGFENKDGAKVLGSMTEELRAVMVGALAATGQMRRQFASFRGEPSDEIKAHLDRFDAILTRHGLSEADLKSMTADGPITDEQRQAVWKALYRKVKDPAGFVSACLTWEANFPGREARDSYLGQTLVDVTIDGDTAHGIARGDGTEERLEFQRIGGSWYISKFDDSDDDEGDWGTDEWDDVDREEAMREAREAMERAMEAAEGSDD